MLHDAAVEAAPEWTGAPLHFTTAYYPPAELDAAFEHWQFLHAHDKTPRQQPDVAPLDHRSRERRARRTRVRALHSRPAVRAVEAQPTSTTAAPVSGELMYQAICEPCEWNGITDSENDAVEMWHDHALPGWRELPIVPSRLRMMDKDALSKAAKKWIVEHYPTVDAGPGRADHHRAPPLRDTARPGPLAVGRLRPLPHRGRS